jgi:hypothetical protein
MGDYVDCAFCLMENSMVMPCSYLFPFASIGFVWMRQQVLLLCFHRVGPMICTGGLVLEVLGRTRIRTLVFHMLSVWQLLVALEMQYSNCITILQGNHESRQVSIAQNSIFFEEVALKS